jgi:hypothetical protein
MGPPLSATPSFTSFTSFRSTSDRNFEVEHSRLLLRGLQDDIQTQRTTYENREQALIERFNEERKLYIDRINELEDRIAELEGNRMGEGGSSKFRRF